MSALRARYLCLGSGLRPTASAVRSTREYLESGNDKHRPLALLLSIHSGVWGSAPILGWGMGESLDEGDNRA